MILCDCGGSNNARYYIFKAQLQELANEIGIEIRIAPYPPYTSKYNPIEHRLFPHVTRACKGLIFDSIKTIKEAISQTTTKTGLEVLVDVTEKIYKTGLKVKEEFKKNMKIIFDKLLPKWNYRAVPESLAT
ncbi:MAG: transposase [Lentisphaerae bacterium GWF2_38_69]|nr:MAG: transposase [Lentisphaerae bacterium GWF2_38_69]